MCFYFFFQAEDGIRDADVTGVQTCALPICFKKGTGDVEPVTMGQVAAGEKIQGDQTLSAHLLPDLVPIIGRELEQVLFAQFFQGRTLNTRAEDCPKSDEVGVGAAVGLNVSMITTKKAAGHSTGILLDGVDIIASGVKPVSWVTLGILVR